MNALPVSAPRSFALQLRMLLESGRWIFLVAGLLLLLVAPAPIAGHAPLGLPPALLANMLGCPAAAWWALAVWQGEVPDRRTWHWSLPVARPAHDLARVAAGAVLLLAAFAVLALAGSLLALTRHDAGRLGAIGSAWVSFFAGPLVIYLIAMPFVLWSDSTAMRRSFAVFLVLALLCVLFRSETYMRTMELIFGNSDWGMSGALLMRLSRDAPDAPGAVAVSALWLALGGGATILAATFRPAEVARIFRRA